MPRKVSCALPCWDTVWLHKATTALALKGFPFCPERIQMVRWAGGEQVMQHICLAGIEGSAELATQTALDLLLNMSNQRELPAGSLEVRRSWLPGLLHVG